MSRRTQGRFAGWLTYLLGMVGGAGLVVLVGSVGFREYPLYVELAFSGTAIEEEGIDEAASDRINRATKLFMEAFILVERQHVESQLDDKLVDKMLNSALSELDPYSGYFDKEVALSMTALGDGGGKPRLGVMVMDVDNAYTIEAVMPFSPAEEAGLLPGDRVVRVGEVYVGQEDPRKVNKIIAAEIERASGGAIKLGLRRPGAGEEITLSVMPTEVNVVGAYDLGREGNVLHLSLERFYEGAAEDVANIIRRELKMAPLEGVMIDLRSNGGGLTTEVKELASFFLEKGSLLYEMSGRRVGVDAVRTERSPEFPELNLAVIVNGSSASASEIFAGAIQAHDRGIIVGWQTYGKGTVQRVYPVEDGAIKITVAKYRDGGLRSINGIGVHPDLVAEYPDPGHRPSRFSPDPVREQARKAIGRKPYVAAQ